MAVSSFAAGGIRWLLPSLILGSSGAALALVFAGLWWHGEARTAQAEEARETAVAELARITGDQSRQRRAQSLARLTTDEQLTLTRQEAADLRRQLGKAETSLAEARGDLAEADRREQDLSSELDAGRQRDLLLRTEREKSGLLEQNLSLAQSDVSNRAALHDEDVRDLETRLISLRGEVSQRDVDVTNLISQAEREISGLRQEASQLQQQTVNLQSELSSANAENDRLNSQVSSLQSELASEQAENARLQRCIYKLECEVKELRLELAAAIAAASHTAGTTPTAAATP